MGECFLNREVELRACLGVGDKGLKVCIMSIHIGYDEKLFQTKNTLKHFPNTSTFSADFISFWILIIRINLIFCIILDKTNWVGP